MINLSLIELAVATCFSSERLADFYKQYLLQPERLFSDGIIERKDFNKACRDILAQSLDIDYPRKFRLNELDAVFELVWPNNVFYSNQLPILDHCFDSLLTDKDNFICYQKDRVTNYSRLLARFDTTILVGWHLAKCAFSEVENPSESERALQYLTTQDSYNMMPIPARFSGPTPRPFFRGLFFFSQLRPLTGMWY